MNPKNMTKTHLFKVTLKVRDDVGVLARITTRLRKFQISIRNIDVVPLDDDERFFDIFMTVSANKEDISVAMNKTLSLIPVMEVEWDKED
jgi:acetolactate synthase small subunit